MNARNDGDAALAAANALAALATAADRIRDAVADHFQVDRSAVAALKHLSGDRPVGSAELAGQLGLSASTVTSLVDRLAGAGLAERADHPTDRRKRVIVLTERGQSAVGWLAELRQAFFVGIDETDLEAATRSMRHIAAQLEKQASRLRTGQPPTSPDGVALRCEQGRRSPGGCVSVPRL